MDEFHSFTDPERGIVWELSLGLLPEHVRTLLLSATVGNAVEFLHWLRHSHKRQLELVAGNERKVPLKYHWVGDMLLDRAARSDGRRRRRNPHHARLGLLLQPRRMLDRGRATQRQADPQRRPAEAARDRIGSVRLVGRRRAEAQAALDARRGRAPCRRAAQVPPHRRRAVPAKTALRNDLHRDAFGRHQPAGPLGRRAQHHERPAGQEEAARPQHGAPDFRPGGPAAVRQGRPRVRAGPRGRREDRPLAREVRPDPRGHERPGPDEGQESR